MAQVVSGVNIFCAGSIARIGVRPLLPQRLLPEKSIVVPENLIIAESPRNQQHPGRSFLVVAPRKQACTIVTSGMNRNLQGSEGQTVFSGGTEHVKLLWILSKYRK